MHQFKPPRLRGFHQEATLNGSAVQWQDCGNFRNRPQPVHQHGAPRKAEQIAVSGETRNLSAANDRVPHTLAASSEIGGKMKPR
jgi:hypothetical protein